MQNIFLNIIKYMKNKQLPRSSPFDKLLVGCKECLFFVVVVKHSI